MIKISIITTLLLGALMLNFTGCISIPKTIEHDESLSFTKINGYKFHTKIVGQEHNKTVIVIHGGPGGDFRYLESLSELSKEYRVVFYDQRGSGLSPRVSSESLTLAQNLEDLHGFVEKFSKEEPAILIGHSWGAILATGYINKYPEHISHVVAVEPGMLHKDAAKAFVKNIKETQDIGDMFVLIRHILAYPFISKVDQHEGFDYVMTQLLNRNKPGAPYQCENDRMPKDSFIRAGYDAFNTMLKPVMDNPELFNYVLTDKLTNYKGKLLVISSECSVFGFEFQEKYHLPFLPEQTQHIKAVKMGHNMITLNPDWSVETIIRFLD